MVCVSAFGTVSAAAGSSSPSELDLMNRLESRLTQRPLFPCRVSGQKREKEERGKECVCEVCEVSGGGVCVPVRSGRVGRDETWHAAYLYYNTLYNFICPLKIDCKL